MDWLRRVNAVGDRVLDWNRSLDARHTHIGADIFPPDPGSASTVTTAPPTPGPSPLPGAFIPPRTPFLVRIAIGAVPALVGWLAWGTPGAIVGGVAGAAIADEIDHG